MPAWLAGLALAIIAAVAGRWLYARVFGPRPKLEVTVRSGGGTGITFTATIVNTGGKPAINCGVTVAVADVGVQPESIAPTPPFDVEVRKEVRFTLDRPGYGELVPAFAGETTLYGEALTLTIHCGRHSWSGTWREVEHDAETNRARYEIQQQIWRNRKVSD